MGPWDALSNEAHRPRDPIDAPPSLAHPMALSEWKDKGQSAKRDGRLSYEKVRDVFTSHKAQTVVYLTLDDGQTLAATEGHPFKTTEGWRDAIMLKKGGNTERTATIAGIRIKLKPFKGKTKTDGDKVYEKDYTHKDMEVYDKRGNHLGSADMETGK